MLSALHSLVRDVFSVVNSRTVVETPRVSKNTQGKAGYTKIINLKITLKKQWLIHGEKHCLESILYST